MISDTMAPRREIYVKHTDLIMRKCRKKLNSLRELKTTKSKMLKARFDRTYSRKVENVRITTENDALQRLNIKYQYAINI